MHKAQKVGSWSRLAGQKLEILFKKMTKAKRGRTVAQVVEHLLSECEALSANPTIKNSPKILKKYQRNYNN
jgi:hypothetical protein